MYQREDSGMNRMPIHSATAGIEHRTSMYRQVSPLPPEMTSWSRKAWYCSALIVPPCEDWRAWIVS